MFVVLVVKKWETRNPLFLGEMGKKQGKKLEKQLKSSHMKIAKFSEESGNLKRWLPLMKITIKFTL